MFPCKLNIVTDGQWGSCGKGLVTTALASKHKPDIISTTNMANAGHTAVWNDGNAFIAKALPSATALTKWMDDYKPTIFIGASAAFDIKQLLKEVQETQLENLLVHPRAGVITEDHKQQENSHVSNSTKHIASTMQGCGTFLADKVLRKQSLKLARDYNELQDYMVEDPHLWLHEQLMLGKTILHEGSQGFSLDINHGSHYPQCTSRSTTAMQNMADLGLSNKHLGQVYLVIRPFPIRVGNVIEDGKVVGYSGDCYEDQKELTWADVMINAKAPPNVVNDIVNKELTTVTKRLRRVFTFSERQLIEAVHVNGATQIALNFANYIDWDCYGMSNYSDLPKSVREFIDRIEDIAQIPVTIVGTGPQNNHVCFT